VPTVLGDTDDAVLGADDAVLGEDDAPFTEDDAVLGKDDAVLGEDDNGKDAEEADAGIVNPDVVDFSEFGDACASDVEEDVAVDKIGAVEDTLEDTDVSLEDTAEASAEVIAFPVEVDEERLDSKITNKVSTC